MNSMFAKKIVSLMIIFCVFAFQLFIVLSAPSALAVSLDQQEGFQGGEISSIFGGKIVEGRSDVITIMVRIIGAVLGLLSIIFIILLIVAGFKYMNARGNDSEVEDALKQIRRAVIGALITLSAWSLTMFVLNNLRDATLDLL